jgi:hypothetical protein
MNFGIKNFHDKSNYFSKITVFIIILYLILTISCSKNSANYSNNFSFLDTNKLLNSYLTALSSVDSNAVKSFWSQSSISRKGFWTIHNILYPWGSFSDWKNSVQGGRFEIQNINNEGDYYLLKVKWLPRDTVICRTKNLKLYIVQENGQWVFINPIDLFTRDWETFSTDHIEFHYPPQININDYLDEIRYTESVFSDALKTFRIQSSIKIDFYKAINDIECGKLMDFGPVNGYTLIPRSAGMTEVWNLWFIASSSFVNHHEIIHLISGLSGIPDKNTAITEGLACAFAGNFHTTGDFIINDARNQILQSFNYPLKILFPMDTRTFYSNNFITYSQSGSFIRFIYEIFGMQKLKDFCLNPLVETDIIKALETTYGQNIENLEKDWIKYLLDKKVPEINTIIPLTAQSFFLMSDAEGDDKGDGDYVYPVYGDYPKGCFDLRKFEVLKDENNVYFRLEFKSIKKPLILGEGVYPEKFVVGSIIAIEKGKGENRHVQKFCHGVKFLENDGYDFKINIGTCISLTNNFGEVFFSSPEIVNLMSKYEKNMIEFSIPIELIGKPLEDWRYFVGTCLISNRIMNFLGEPTPVYKKPPVPIFISGGNYDHGNPPYMDILLPSWINQTNLLNNYTAEIGGMVVVPMIGQDDRE